MRESAVHLADLSRRLLELQEDERRHLARERHDEIGQLITGLKLSLETCLRLPVEAIRARHAAVDEAEVRLGIQGETVIVQVGDQGTNFNSHVALATGRTSGLAGMRERTQLLGGHLIVESSPGEGTLVRAQLPLYPPANRLGTILTDDRYIVEER